MLRQLAKLATTFQGVESTHYGQDIVEELFRITQVIRIGGIVLIAFLAAATLFIISNTIRLTVFARRKRNCNHEICRCNKMVLSVGHS